MAITFPTPNMGDPSTLIVTEAGITWTWNNTLGVWSTDISSASDDTAIGDTPPASPQEGDLWWNSSDDSGRLYVYYDEGDGGSAQWVEASPQVDSLTEEQSDNRYLSKVSDDTAAGAITFEGLTTHEAGVKVTSGDEVTVEQGLYESGGNLRLAAGSQRVATFGASGRVGFPSAASAAGVYINNTPSVSAGLSYGIWLAPDWSEASGTIVYGINTNSYNGPGTLDVFAGYRAAGTADSTKFANAGSIQAGFLAKDTISGAAAINAGFYSELTSFSSSNYNFYATGNAPNYFAGPVITGSIENPANISNCIGGSGRDLYITSGAVNSSNTAPLQMMGINGGNGKNLVYATFSASIYSSGRDPVRTGYITSIDRTGVRFVSSDGSPVRILADSSTTANVAALGFNASNVVKLLQPKQFDLNGRTQLGFLAPELKTHVPLAVDDHTEEENGPVREGYDPLQLIPLLTKALQEVVQKNEDLEARIAALEGA